MLVFARQFFLDANLALHYRRPDEIDWQNILGIKSGDNILLLIAPVLVRELEKQKVHNEVRGLRSRAANFLMWLESSWTTDNLTRVRDGVYLKFVLQDPTLSFDEHRLSASIADDWLIATAIEYRNSANTSVSVTTSDLGLKLKLRSYGFDPFSLPDDCLLPPAKDLEQAELEKLRREVAEFKSRVPKLSVSFLNGTDRVTIPPLKPLEDKEPFIDRCMREIQTKYPKLQGSKDLPKLPKSLENSKNAEAISGILEIVGSYQGGRADTYNSQLVSFFSEYENYLAEYWRVFRAHQRSHEFRLLLHNDGQAVATDIDISLSFPADIEMLLPSELPRFPKQPKAPTVSSILDLFGSGSAMNPLIDMPRVPSIFEHLRALNPTVVGPTIDKDKRKVSIWLGQLKHYKTSEFDPLIFTYPGDKIENFNCAYELHSAEMSIVET